MGGIGQMDRRIDAHIARTQFGQIMDLATKNNERFIVDRRGEPAVVIMSVQDFIRTAAPPPDWLEKAWSGAKRRGLDTLTPADIEAEIAAHRRKQDPVTPAGRSDPGGHRYQCDGLRPSLSHGQRGADPTRHSSGVGASLFLERDPRRIRG